MFDFDISLPGEENTIEDFAPKKKVTMPNISITKETAVIPSLYQHKLSKDVNYLSLGGDLSPMKHQTDCFHKLYNLEYAGIFGEQGTGKTRMAIDLVSNHFAEGSINAVLLIAPKGVHEQWYTREILKHSPVEVDRFMWEAKSTKSYLNSRKTFIDKPTERLKWFCVNIDTFSSDTNIFLIRDYLKKHECAVVVDESTRIKNPTSNRTYNIMYNLAALRKRGKVVEEVLPHSVLRYILTGMQVTNGPYDIWAPFNFLKFNFFEKNFFAFKAKYGIEISDVNKQTGMRFQRRVSPNDIAKIISMSRDKEFTFEQIACILGVSEKNVEYICLHPNIRFPYKHLDELRSAIEPFSYTIRKEDCLDLPPKIYQIVKCQMGTEQKRVYNELKKKLITEFENKPLTVPNKLALVTRLQQITSGFFPYVEKAYNEENDIWESNSKPLPLSKKNPKFEALKAQLDEDGADKIFISCRFVSEIKFFEEQLKKSYPDKIIKSYYGSINDTDRNKIKNDFENGEIDILLINVRMAIGFNFQKHCHKGYAISGTYSLEDRKQWEDRIHRIGQEKSVNYIDFIMTGTIDEKIYEVIENKQSLLDYFRDHSVSEFLQ